MGEKEQKFLSDWTEKDRKFFEENWAEWIKRNPPSEKWVGTLREWAECEMPCRGFFGRWLFSLDKRLDNG